MTVAWRAVYCTVLVAGYSSQSPPHRILSDNQMNIFFLVEWHDNSDGTQEWQQCVVICWEKLEPKTHKDRFGRGIEPFSPSLVGDFSITAPSSTFQDHTYEQNGVTEFETQSILVVFWFTLSIVRGCKMDALIQSLEICFKNEVDR